MSFDKHTFLFFMCFSIYFIPFYSLSFDLLLTFWDQFSNMIKLGDHEQYGCVWIHSKLPGTLPHIWHLKLGIVKIDSKQLLFDVVLFDGATVSRNLAKLLQHNFPMQWLYMELNALGLFSCSDFQGILPYSVDKKLFQDFVCTYC